MRILYFHQHFTTPAGSAGTRSYEFSRALVSSGHEVIMVCGSRDRSVSGLRGNFKNGVKMGVVDGINIIEVKIGYSNHNSLLKRTFLFFKYMIFGIYFALKLDYDLVFCTSTPLTAGIPGIFGKIIRNKKFIFEVRDLWPELPREMGVIKNPILLMLMDELEYLSYKYADKCIALAPGILEGIKKKAPLKQIALIPNGCDHLEVESVTKKKNKFIAVFTGAHGIANGLHAILDMANYLLEIGVDDIEIHFIGDGKEKDGLVERSKREKLRNCRFFDPMPKKVLFKYLMENADVGLMVLENIPAFYNGTSPNKFFDYLAVGIPVVNNYPGWIAEIIKKNDCGIPVPPGNPKKFAEAIISLRDNRVLYEKMKKNSFNLSISDFDRQKLAIKFVKYLTK